MKKTLKELQEAWRGKGKLKIISAGKMRDGRIRVTYNEAGEKDNDFFICKDEQEYNEFLRDFRGQNDETVATYPELRDLKSFNLEAIRKRGHRVIKMTVAALKHVSSKERKHQFPAGSGTPYFPGRKGKHIDEDAPLIVNEVSREEVGKVTRQFEREEEAEVFINFLLNDRQLGKLTWHVMEFVTENEDSKICTWLRAQAGDGSKSMEMQLVEVSGKRFNSLMITDIIAAAGDMHYKNCEKLEMLPVVHSKMACSIAFREGRVDEFGRKVKHAQAPTS